MDATSEPLSEIVVPATLFGDMRAALEKEAGPLVAVHALHAAGYAAGVAAVAAFRSAPDEDVLALPQEAFWTRLASFFERRGWGSLVHQPAHPAVGLLTSPDWAESAGVTGEDASCSFTAGFLSGMLSTLAGGPVAVLEVGCRARGEAHCTFAFGNALAIHDLYGELLQGADVSQALSSL